MEKYFKLQYGKNIHSVTKRSMSKILDDICKEADKCEYNIDFCLKELEYDKPYYHARDFYEAVLTYAKYKRKVNRE